jgi:hypothetical protein
LVVAQVAISAVLVIFSGLSSEPQRGPRHDSADARNVVWCDRSALSRYDAQQTGRMLLDVLRRMRSPVQSESLTIWLPLSIGGTGGAEGRSESQPTNEPL